MAERQPSQTPGDEAERHARTAEIAVRFEDNEIATAGQLGARAATLLGFAAVILTLTLGLAREALAPDTGLERGWEILVVVALLASVVCLACSALLAVQAARPQSRPRVDPSVLDTYREHSADVGAINEHFGRRTAEAAKKLADANTDRAGTLLWAFRWLVGGLSLSAVQAVIIGCDYLVEVLK